MNFEGFMYLDVENPLVAWNTYRAVLVSQKLVQQSMGSAFMPAFSMTAAKMFMDRDWSRLRFEYELEKVRTREFPTSVSRLHCLFVFDEPESALAAASDESWGGHISDENLTDVGVSAAPNSTRVDANWISWMLQFHQHGDVHWRAGIRPYWMGHVCPHFSRPIWEVLLDGTITVWGTALRQRAYEVTKQRSPSTVSLLEQSRLAASLGSDLGHVSALVTTEKEKPLLSFFMDMRDAGNSAYTDRLADYIVANPNLVNFTDLAVGGDRFLKPNFVMYSYVFGS
jgi:hypothetical protein